MTDLRGILKFILGISVFVGCSEVRFRSPPPSTPSSLCQSGDNREQSCQIQSDGTVGYKMVFRTGEVDVLFIDDNSGSMYDEQLRMSERFPNFISGISGLFYRIGIITPDVTATPGNTVAREANGNGKFQDGKLLEFVTSTNAPTGKFFIEPETVSGSELFQSTIQRPETRTCAANGYKEGSCPSDDERPIYALNLALKRNEKSFFRTGSHLSVVFLSDEDERSTGGKTSGYPLEALDYPVSVLEVLKDSYPSKSLSVHAVIIKPGDSTCLSQQQYRPPGSSFFIFGKEGNILAQLAAPQIYNSELASYSQLKTGVLGSICASDYGAQLGNIASIIQSESQKNDIKLNCKVTANDLLVTSSDGRKVAYNFLADDQIRISGLPAGLTITVQYACPLK